VKFPIINISDKSFRANKKFVVLYSNQLRSSYLKLEKNYLNQEFIDSEGCKYFISNLRNIDGKKNLTEGSIYWLNIFWAIEYVKTLINRKKIDYVHELIFGKIAGNLTLEEFKNKLLEKIDEFKFIDFEISQEEFIAEVMNSDSFEQLMNLVAE
jgi:hypothetical protein